MKKSLGFALLLLLTSTTFCQQVEYSHTLEKQDYLGKSKKQKTGAWILLSGGFVLSATGALIAATEVTIETGSYIIYSLAGSSTEEPKASNTSGILFFTGLASMVGSIPLFIASSRNKSTAAMISTSIKFEEGSLVRKSAITKIQFPAITVNINF